MLDLQSPPLPAHAVVVAAVAAGLAQLVLARWRDLGPATVAACGIAATLAPSWWPTWAAIAAAAAIGGIAWARAGAVGIGHPSLSAVTFAVAAVVDAGIAAWTAWDPSTVPDAARPGGAAVIGAVGLVALTVALRRPGARHPRVRWVGEVRVPISGAAAE